jgi:LemA protein
VVTIPWWLFALAVVLAFWGIGAHNRLHGLRRGALVAFGPLAAALTARRAAVLDTVAQVVASPADLSDPPNEADVYRARLVDGLRHAAGQAASAQAAAAGRPLAPGRLGGLSIAETVFEQSIAAVASRLEAAPGGGIRSRGLAQAELELAMARQAFNRAVEAYNGAIAQPPASLLAVALRFRPVAPMAAGPSLAVATAPGEVAPSGAAQPVQAA